MGEEFMRLTIEQYKIYKKDGYYLCISDLENNNYQLFIGFSDKDLGMLTREQIVSEIRKISDLINSVNKSGIFILPIIDLNELEQAAMENDDKLFYEIMSKKIQPITREVYELLKRNNKNIESVIRMIKQTDADRKFIDWMDMKLMESGVDYIEDIEYEELKGKVSKKEEPNMVKQDNYVIPPIDRTYEDTMSQNRSNQLVRKLVKPNDQRSPSGFSNISFIIIVISIALILGIGFSYLLIK